MRFTDRVLPVAFALAAALPTVASAQLTGIQYVGAKFTTGNTVTIGIPSVTPVVEVGPYLAHFTSPLSANFDIFCIDWDNIFDTTTPFNARVLSFNDAISTTLTYNGISNFTALKRIFGTTEDGGRPITDSPAEYLQRLNATASLSGQFGGAGPQTSWDEIQYAIWTMFNAEPIPSADGFGGDTTSLRANALGATYAADQYASYSLVLDAKAWDPDVAEFYQQVAIVTPEPGTWAMFGMGLLGVMAFARRRSRRNS